MRYFTAAKLCGRNRPRDFGATVPVTPVYQSISLTVALVNWIRVTASDCRLTEISAVRRARSAVGTS
jgi:hypothetical protein